MEDEFGAKDYRAQMILKPDNEVRPLWVVCVFYHCLYTSKNNEKKKIGVGFDIC